MNNEIPVVILCGGLGTRIREETEYRPKPMIEIGKKPILWHIMKIYSFYEFKKFILCLGYKGNTIKDYFLNYEMLNSDFTIELGNRKSIKIHGSQDKDDWHVTMADTGENTLKGGRIKRIEKYVDTNTFMLTYGDGLANINIKELISFHKDHGKIGTVTGVRPPSRFGEMDVKDSQVISFTEKPQISAGLINGGYFVFNKEIFDYLSEDECCDFEIGPLERLADDNELRVYLLKGEWACMDTFRDMQYLNKLWKAGESFWKVWDE
jgi:glucose-1-phosphate cytidylyltransferase